MNIYENSKLTNEDETRLIQVLPLWGYGLYERENIENGIATFTRVGVCDTYKNAIKWLKGKKIKVIQVMVKYD